MPSYDIHDDVSDMIEAVNGRANLVSLRSGDYRDSFVGLLLDETSNDHLDVGIDYYDDGPELHVYDETQEEPVVTVRFPTDENDIDSIELRYGDPL